MSSVRREVCPSSFLSPSLSLVFLYFFFLLGEIYSDDFHRAKRLNLLPG